MFRVPGHGQSEVDRPAHLRAGVAALVVAGQVVREQKVTAVSSEFDAGTQVEGWIEQGGVPRALAEHPSSAFGEEALVLEVRARPQPQVAGSWGALVAQEDSRQQSERARGILVWSMSIDVWTTGQVTPPWHRRRDLDVVKGVVELERGNQLVRDVERSRCSQRCIAPGELCAWPEPEIGSGATGALIRLDPLQELIDLSVCLL